MNKFSYVLCSILTLGIFNLCIRHKAKNTKTNDTLSFSTKYNFKIVDFINDLGGVKNIKNVSATLSSVSINLADINLINPDLKNKYKIHGLNKSANNLILIFGDNAKQIAQDIKANI